jgi:2-polyprenyl-3-methyl-5-hydroxy-6-metoxy-1,4-benzoquinol methylase
MEQTVHPERFDPREGEGTLIDTEHRARYWWASRLVAGKDVLDAGCGLGYGTEILASAGARAVSGVDIDPAAVEEAESRFGESAAAIVEGDLQELPLDDDSFDAVVCFEAIEHVEDGGRALAELRRVLRPDGLLLVSSPNPDVYPSGNEHHVHEYRPAELAAAVGEHFAHVSGYRQHPWLASTIEPAGDDAADPPDGLRESQQVRRTAALEPGDETFGIVAASDEELPAIADVTVLGNAFEVDWWSEQVANGRARGDAAAREARRATRAAKKEAREAIAAAEERARRHIQETDDNARQAVAQSAARESAATERLREASAALLEANQELAQLPLLRHRMEVLQEEHEHVCALFAEVQSSTSWRLTAPLRRLALVLSARR